jgi:hypothetical protein
MTFPLSSSETREKWEDYKIWHAGMSAVAFRQLLKHVSNSENDNKLPIKDNTILYDMIQCATIQATKTKEQQLQKLQLNG